MNSRDSMYEEEVKAAMEASRREALGLSPMPKSAPEEIMEDDEADKQEVKKGKRKRDREDHDPSESQSRLIGSRTHAVRFGRPWTSFE